MKYVYKNKERTVSIKK